MGEIKNIRYGLATNSSSTHSIVHIANSREKYADELTEDGRFGWNFFTAASPEAKRDYMFGQLMLNVMYRRDCESSIAGFVNLYAPEYADTLTKTLDGYVDHNSKMTFPRYVGSDYVNIEFFTEYSNYIIENDFAVLGGNDNDGYSHPLHIKSSNHPMDDVYGVLSCGKLPIVAHKNGNYWVMYDGKNTKYRVSFTDEPLTPALPELVDVKITDYCDIGCSFCYQGSTEDGKHAEVDSVRAVLPPFNSKARIEYAVGGGEPTSHPKFAEILEILNHYGENIVNFTTKSKKWFNDSKKVEAMVKYVSGIAYSVSSTKEIEEFAQLHMEHCGDRVRMYIHIIPELIGLKKTKEIVDFVSEWNKDARHFLYQITITMLGFKETGRGAGIEYSNLGGLMDVIVSAEEVNIGIDTKLATDYAEELERVGIDKRLYTTKEGEFSMYYDAVTKKAYKSSYDLEKSVDCVKEKGRHYTSYKPLSLVFEKVRDF